MIGGKIRVDFSRLRLVHPDLLEPCLPGPPDENKIKQILAKDLDAGLAQSPPFYYYGLTIAEQKAGKPAKPLDSCLLHTSRLEKYLECYDAWVGTHDKAPLLLRSVLWNNVAGKIGALKSAAARTDFAQTEATFNVRAFGGRWSDRLPEPLHSNVRVRRADLAGYLDRFDDGLWRQEIIQGLLVDFFARRGWAPDIRVPAPGAFPNLAIAISPAPPIVQATFAPPVEDAALRARLLYLLLPARQFEQAKGLPAIRREGRIPYEVVDLKDLSPPVPFNQLAFAQESQEAAALGFTASAVNTGSGINLQFEKNRNAETKGKAAARPPVDRECLNAPPGDAQACAPEPPPRDKTRFIGGGFDYIPGEGVRPLAAFNWQRLAGAGGVSVEAGAANRNPFVSGSASFDFIGFGQGPGQLHHRLGLTLTGGTEATANRLFGSRPLNERRNGGSGRIDYELFRDRLGHSLSVYAGAGDQNVALTDVHTGADAIGDNLATAFFGAVHTLSGLGAARPYRLRLEPAVRVGRAAAGAFYRMTASAAYHQESLGNFAFDCNAHYEYASRQTPVYELPSFGGAAIVRGFRPDEFLGRQFWSVQPEVWTPVPGLSAGSGNISRFVSRNVRLAAFFDAGGVYQVFELPTPAAAGLKGAPGAGVRFLSSQVTLRLDWAYGIGRAPGGPPWGRVYFSVSTPMF